MPGYYFMICRHSSYVLYLCLFYNKCIDISCKTVNVTYEKIAHV